jgi:hypothetical protein
MLVISDQQQPSGPENLAEAFLKRKMAAVDANKDAKLQFEAKS